MLFYLASYLNVESNFLSAQVTRCLADSTQLNSITWCGATQLNSTHWPKLIDSNQLNSEPSEPECEPKSDSGSRLAQLWMYQPKTRSFDLCATAWCNVTIGAFQHRSTRPLHSIVTDFVPISSIGLLGAWNSDLR